MTAPTVDTIKGYLGETSYTDAELGAAVAAEAAAQSVRCRVPADDAEWPADLVEALCRRVARNLSLRNVPLAVLQGDAELGLTSSYLPATDPEVRRLEAPWRRLVVG